MKQNDKISKFVAAITKEADERRSRIMQETEDLISAELKKAEDEALEESYYLIQRKIAAIHAQINRDTAALRQELKADLFRRREEITAEILAHAKAKILEFTSSEHYEPFLRRSCEQAVGLLGSGPMTVCLRREDLRFEDAIRRVLPVARFKEDDSIRLGGLKFESADGKMIADDTLDERLNSQRNWFFEACGL